MSDFEPVQPPTRRVCGGSHEESIRLAGVSEGHEVAARPPDGGASYVVHVLDNSPQLLDRIRAASTGVVGFLELPMLIVAASGEEARQLSEIRGLIVADVGRPLARLEPLLRGLDVMAAVEALSAAGADVPSVVGGTRRGIGGYPILIDRDGTRLIGSDETNTFDTRPASLAVINLSLEPPRTAAGAWPWHDLDPVNMATRWIAARQLCVFASGNQDERVAGREVTTAWAEAPWVISVGATIDPEGVELAPYSNTGVAGVADSGPAVVAWGASLIDPAQSATSYAAPKVSGIAVFLASMIEQLRHHAQLTVGEPALGVPLVGVGFIDKDFRWIDANGPRRTPIPALPAAAVDGEGLRHALNACSQAGISIDITFSPHRLRRMILAAARPMPDYKPHQVGAGFVSDDVVLAWLERWTAKDLVLFFAESEVSSAEVSALPDAPIFGSLEELRELQGVTMQSTPIWRWDFGTSSFSMRRERVEPD